jgi:hypothetical protein
LSEESELDRFPRANNVVFESSVVKLSGANILGRAKWDSRTLRSSVLLLLLWSPVFTLLRRPSDYPSAR